MGGNKPVLFSLTHYTRVVSVFLVLVTVISTFAFGITPYSMPKTAEAAEVVIDSNVSATVTEQLVSGAQSVFISDQVGYKFFVDEVGYCVYRKTSDGGATWSSTTTVDAQTDCGQVSVWYDKWTPGSASSSIHIATIDSSADDIWYNRLDTLSDTLLLGSSPVSMFTGSGQGGTTLTTGENFVSITRATNGTIYAISNDGTGTNDSAVLECTSNCSINTQWTETTNPLDVASDQNVLLPVADGDIMIIQRDISADTIRSRVWDDSVGSWNAWQTVDPDGIENTTYDVGIAATVSSSTPGRVYLAYTADNDVLGTDDDVRVGYYNGTSWSTTTLQNVVSNQAARSITGVAIGLDTSNEDVYVAYSARTTSGTPTSANIYWKVATSSMGIWSAEQGPVNTTADDIYGIDMNIASDERLYVSWYEATPDDMFGDTLQNIFPGVHASSSGTQTTTANASTSSFYLGGKFLLYNTYKPADVSAVTLTESGTIDGSTGIRNVRLFYETDTTAPYNCGSESYAGTESQFGSTDVNGFSGADGTSAFTGTTVEVSTTSALCLYPVLDITDVTPNASTIEISISNPTLDITVSNGQVGPSTAVSITGATTVSNDMPTLMHYHWRNDNGSETTATSKTSGTEDTALTSMRQASTTRLRLTVSNEGGSTTPSMQYRLEYASNPGTCDAATGWTDVGSVGGDFDMSNSANLTDGGNTTNIAVASGGVTDENTTFLTPNGGIKDTSSETSGILLTSTQYVELEYSIIASTTATEGNTYCFRVTDRGNPLYAYNQYPRANIAADILVTIATSSQVTSFTIPTTTAYVGSGFVITENTSTRNITSITIEETGTVDASTGLDNIRLRYDLDTTNPYNCAGESYNGTESQFGATDTDGFSSANGTSTFTGSVALSTTSTMCLYVVTDVTGSAQNGETINIAMENPSVDVLTSPSGSVSPTILRDLNGSTTLQGAILTQTHYHWRSDNGSETTATSLSGGSEDTAVSNIAVTTPVRLRLQVSNEGAVTSGNTAFRIEYGAKITSCSAVTSWTDVGETGGAWNMATSTNLSDAANTTNIAVANGGVTDENTTFISPNLAVKEASSTVATTTLTSTQFFEMEFSMKQTDSAGYDITYCFRVTNGGTALNAYTRYAELTTAPERDFEIQRGFVTITSTSTTLVAGINYNAPSASTSAFIRITNIGLTGAGHNTGNTAAQNATDVTAYILDPGNITNSVTIARRGTTNNTRVDWEIVEFIGEPGSDNEMIVRDQSRVTYTTTGTVATGTAVSNISDDTDVVVFITGQAVPTANSTTYPAGQSTSAWSASTDQPVFTRGATSTSAATTSYAVVEFKGMNWLVQRNEHTYANANQTEFENIAPVGSLARTFIHTQKRNKVTSNGTDEYGAEVWLSSIGQLSFFLESGASFPGDQTSVTWIIENTQTSSGAMVVTRDSWSTSAGTAPLTVSRTISALTDITNTSISANARSSVAGTTFPRAMAGARIASTTAYEIWRSNTGSTLTMRVELIEWPTAGLALQQTHYWLFEDNNALLPTDPWPGEVGPLGEDTSITAGDNPLGEGERVRIRMAVQAQNATLPLGTRAFRLEYGQMVTTCSAIPEANWFPLGNSASSTIWRGFSATGTVDGTVLSGNPYTPGDLLLTLSDVAGTLEEENDSASTPYAVSAGDEIEYDWFVEQNGANAETNYCFRMVDSDGTPLDEYLSSYPQLRTASFTPRTQNWRWYDDEGSVTPTVSLAGENVAPADVPNGEIVKLRVTVKETKNISRDDVRFRLQFSEYSNFALVENVVATTSCTATSTWCYANGGGTDNADIASSTLSDAESCVGGVGSGCGTHNESPNIFTGHRHTRSTAEEYEFTIQSAGPRVNRVYYFRLYDTVQDVAVPINTGESYPSLVTEGGSLSFAMEGLASSTVIEGVTLDIDTTPSTLNFGTLAPSTTIEGAHRLSVDANGTQGYQLYMTMDSELMSSSGDVISQITGTNASPVAWLTGCSAVSTGCFGYHTGDDTLSGGSTRFSAIDTYARLSTTTLDEIGYSSQPVLGDTIDVIFRIIARDLQEAGTYESNIMYISVPIF